MGSHTHTGQSTPSTGVVGVASNSLTKYSSLTTPFYQAPPPSIRPNQQQQQQQQQQLLKGNGGKTPKNVSSPYGSSLVRSPESIPFSRPTPPSSVPFGKLMKCTGSIQTLNSFNPNSVGMSQPPSIFSTPPGSLSSPNSHQVVIAGSKGVISRRNSSSKLSALTEEKLQSIDLSSVRKKNTGQGSSEKSSSGGFDIITKSCLLDSEDDIENISAAEEDNFPAGLDMSFTEFEDEDAGGEELKGSGTTAATEYLSGEAAQRQQQQQQHHTGRPFSNFHQLSQVPQSPHPPMPQSQDAHFTTQPPGSGKVGATYTTSRPTSIRPRRTASFTEYRDSQQAPCKEIHVKSCSFTSAEDAKSTSFLKSRLLPSAEVEEEIIPMRVPFAFAGSSTQPKRISLESRGMSTELSASPQPLSRGRGSRHSNAAVFRGGKKGNGNKVSASLGSLSLEEMKETLELAEELQAMAKARQGPILLLSTSLSLVSKTKLK